MSQEHKDLHEMTLEEMQKYDGPLFYATIRWMSPGGMVNSDFTSTTAENEQIKIDRVRTIDRRATVSYNHIVTHTGIVIERDRVTGKPKKDTPERYVRTAIRKAGGEA